MERATKLEAICSAKPACQRLIRGRPPTLRLQNNWCCSTHPRVPFTSSEGIWTLQTHPKHLLRRYLEPYLHTNSHPLVADLSRPTFHPILSHKQIDSGRECSRTHSGWRSPSSHSYSTTPGRHARAPGLGTGLRSRARSDARPKQGTG